MDGCIRRLRTLTLVPLAVTWILACRPSGSPGRDVGSPSPGEMDRGLVAGEFEATAAVRATLESLYEAFDFDGGGEADWDGMSALFAPGAAFVAPIADGGRARVQDEDGFLSDFREWVRTSVDVREGLHERILHARIDGFGNVAHAWVAFEGFVPETGEARTLGLDSVQLVRSEGEWKIISFSSHYAGDGADLPDRFLR